jgi:hypothetical protein
MKKLLIAALAFSASAIVLAKLPAPSDEAKAKAAEAAAKTAWTGKVDGYKLCKSQDAVAAKTAKAGKAGKPAATPPCADPGAFVYTPPEAAKPLEASGAHSPASTAAAPPSTKAPAAAIAPAAAAPAKKS